MDKHPVNFRRSKLVKFIKEQQMLIDETVAQLNALGQDSTSYREAREAILERLRVEFKISREEG